MAQLAVLLALPATRALAQTTSTITDNIANPLVQNDYLWLESHLTQVQFSGAPANFTAHIWITGAALSFTYNSVAYNIPLPDAELTFSSSNGSTPSITYSGGTWESNFPKSGTTNPFTTGVMYQVPSALNGFTIAGNGASLTEHFSTDYSAGALNVNWQWSAAQYTQTKTDFNDLQVTPADGVVGSYHAGTPVSLVSYVVAGGTGGGGSNFTGSNSGTAGVNGVQYLANSPIAPTTPVPEASTWAAIGFVTLATAGAMARRIRR